MSADLAPRRSVLFGSRAACARSGHHARVVFGAHVVLYSSDADADRAFLSEVFGFDFTDAGGGWLIFGLPPAEVAVHPAESHGSELYLMCHDLGAERQKLAAHGVVCSEVEEARWGSVIKIRLPGGGELGLYQPRHPTMVDEP
jgi:catechol 2,3-dioxygenase-like lactoylglutathione lyase family enzyme